MGDETANIVAQGVSRLPEAARTSIEAAKAIFELLGKLLGGAKNTALGIGGAIKQNTSYGKVLQAANDSNSPLLQQSGISRTDMSSINKLCVERNIPVSFIKHKGVDSVTAVFAGNFKEAFADVMKETLKQKLAVNPANYSMLRLNRGEAASMKEMLERNGTTANFIKGKNDKEIVCVFQNKDRQAVETIRNDYKALRDDLSKNFVCGFDNKTNKFYFSDRNANKTIQLNNIHTHSHISSVLQQHFGYDSVKASAAANIFGSKLNEHQRPAYAFDSRQRDMLNGLNQNIKLPNENALLRDIDFTRLNYKNDGKERLFIQNGEKSVMIVPAEMKRGELEKTVREKLGVSDNETVKQICGKAETLQKTFADKKTAVTNQGKYGIERISEKDFNVTLGDKTERFSFSDRKQSIAALKNKFGMSENKAEEIFDKAKKQNALTNSIYRAKEKSAKNAASSKIDNPLKSKTNKKGTR
jgi:hypothetical protein